MKINSVEDLVEALQAAYYAGWYQSKTLSKSKDVATACEEFLANAVIEGVKEDRE